MINRTAVSGAVTVLRLDHGAVSALDLELLEALRKELADLAAAGAALVLTGTGSAFSAGVDLFRILDGGESYSEPYLSALMAVFEGLFRYPRPVVVAVNGHAIAGGCVVACAGDYRLMAAGRGRIGVPELLVGVPFPALALEMVRFTTADRGIQQLVYTGSLLLPDEAKDRGLVDEVVPPEQLLERAVARAEQMAAVPASTFWHTKWSLREPVLRRAEENGRQLDAEMRHIWASSETAAAISDYVRTTFGSRRLSS